MKVLVENGSEAFALCEKLQRLRSLIQESSLQDYEKIEAGLIITSIRDAVKVKEANNG